MLIRPLENLTMCDQLYICIPIHEVLCWILYSFFCRGGGGGGGGGTIDASRTVGGVCHLGGSGGVPQGLHLRLNLQQLLDDTQSVPEEFGHN